MGHARRRVGATNLGLPETRTPQLAQQAVGLIPVLESQRVVPYVQLRVYRGLRRSVIDGAWSEERRGERRRFCERVRHEFQRATHG
jgi:hypothetical protein